MKEIIRRGEIYIAHLGKYNGSVQGGVRPVAILSNNAGNYFSDICIVAPITTKKRKKHLPVHANIGNCGYCLENDSKVLLEQIRVINQSQLQQCVGFLDESELADVEKALLISLGMGEGVKS